jgi:TolB-like protein/Tfp pilus assembly protein PilF
LVAVVAALIALNVVGLRVRLSNAVGAVRDPPLRIQSVAVLPLENLSRDPEQEYFADGMTEELITSLGKVSALRVISRTSVMQYKRTKKPLPQIARELNVDAVVEGAVLRSGSRVRITTQLVQAKPEKHLWANSYENELHDVLVLQGEVARAIVSEIRIKLTPKDRTRLNTARPINPEAYEAFVKGRHFWDIYTPEAQLKCVQCYEQAIQKDPTCALAYAQMAHCYDMLAFMEQPPAREYQQKARAAAQKALDLDGQLAEAHMIFADQKYWVDWDWAAGEAAFRRAMELNPASVEVVGHYGTALQIQGRFGEALPFYERAAQLDPLSPTVNSFLARAMFNAHQEQRAMEQYGKMLDLDPNDAGAYAGLGSLYEATGRNDQAISAYLKAASLGGESAERVEVSRNAYKASGMQGYWKKRLDYLKERAKRERVSPWVFALSYARAGEKEHALEWLEKAYHQHTPMLVWLKAERTWDPLRSDPRFQDLLRRMNFPP